MISPTNFGELVLISWNFRLTAKETAARGAAVYTKPQPEQNRQTKGTFARDARI
jgi:hypothetical protein